MILTDTFQNLAVDLLAAFEATAVTLRRVTTLYDVATLTTATSTMDYPTVTLFRLADIKNDNGATKRKTVATLAARDLPVMPQVGDLLITTSQTYAIREIETVAPSNTAIVYRLICGAA